MSDIVITPKVRIQPDNLNEYIENIDINYKTPKDVILGTFITRTLELKLSGISSEIPEEIKISIGMIEETELINQPTFLVKNITSDESTGDLIIKGEDYSSKFNDNFDLELTYPITNLQLAKAICNSVGVILENENFVNSDFVMNVPKIDNKDTKANIISMIAAVAGGIAFINENDRLEIRTPTLNDIQIKDIFEQELKNAKIGPVNSVVLAREPQRDYIQLKEDQSIKIHGKTEIKITNNYIVDDNREGAIQGIYDELLGLEFYCEKINTYLAYKIKPFDLITVDNKPILVNTIRIQYPNFLDGLVGIEQLSKFEVNTAIAKGIEKRIINAEIKVDKVEGKIDSIVSLETENNKKISQVEQDVNEIKQSVKSVANYKRETNGVTEIHLVDAGKLDILKLEVLGNKTYENNLYPGDLFLSESLYPNMKGSELL